MKVVIVNKSDTIGGAAVVSYRLTEALRDAGIDARMLVVDKRSDAEWVTQWKPKWRIRIPFIAERLRIFLANGLNRADLFKVDSASDGLPIHAHPLVKEADVVILNWVNQGMLSLNGLKKLLALKKPVFWTMHDLWCATGICHHTGHCDRYKHRCGNCHFLGKGASEEDLSRRVWMQKRAIYGKSHIRFVAVSSWLAHRSAESSLLHDADITTIHNAFPLENAAEPVIEKPSDRISLIFGAARLDDPIKGLPILRKALQILRDSGKPCVDKMELVTFGSIREPAALEGLALPHRHLGVLEGFDAIRRAYTDSHIVVSSSHFETLPGTLIEGMAFGCVPVAFDRGGQRDIVDDGVTGFLADWDDDEDVAARNLALAILSAADNIGERMSRRMHSAVTNRFASDNITRQWLSAINAALS